MKIGQVDIQPWTKIEYNNTPYSERMIEVPLMLWFLDWFYPKNIIEVGAVSPYYLSKVEHEVYDPFDPHEKCIRKTAEEIDYEGKFLLSISTIEHIGRGDYGQPAVPGAAIPVLDKMMTAQKYLITWAASQNPELDAYAETIPDLVIKLKRTGERVWEKQYSLSDTVYGSPYSFGNGLYVVTNCYDLLKEEPVTDTSYLLRENLTCSEDLAKWLVQKIRKFEGIPGPLTILEARYGSISACIHVQGTLQRYIERDCTLIVPVNNVSMGGDPAPGKKKLLQVVYRYKGEIQRAEVPEGGTLTLGEL